MLLNPAQGSQGIGVPAPARAKGLVNRVFSSVPNLSNVDLSDTRSGGFDWYTHNKWPLANANGTAWAPIVTSAPTPSGYFSMVGGHLSISSDISGVATGISTAASTGTGSTYVGTKFSGSMYVEVAMSFDPANSSMAQASEGAWPIFWLPCYEFYNGTITNTNFVEIDGFEFYPTGTGSGEALFTVHDWNTSNGTNNDNYPSNSPTLSPAPTYTNINYFGLRRIVAADNGGTGLIDWFVNGTNVVSVSYTSSTGTTPALAPSDPTGSLYEGDSKSFILTLGAGYLQPTQFASVAVYQ